MGKRKKEHRKKVQARNQRLQKEEATLMNMFKKLQEMGDVDLNKTNEPISNFENKEKENKIES